VTAGQYSASYKNPPVTLFAPNDAAVKNILASLTPTQAVLTKLIGQHIVRGAWPLAKLAALPANTKLVTFTAGKVLTKVSAARKFPIMLKGAKPVITALAVKPIYQGQWICIYGASKVVPSVKGDRSTSISTVLPWGGVGGGGI